MLRKRNITKAFVALGCAGRQLLRLLCVFARAGRVQSGQFRRCRGLQLRIARLVRRSVYCRGNLWLQLVLGAWPRTTTLQDGGPRTMKFDSLFPVARSTPRYEALMSSSHTHGKNASKARYNIDITGKAGFCAGRCSSGAATAAAPRTHRFVEIS